MFTGNKKLQSSMYWCCDLGIRF